MQILSEFGLTKIPLLTSAMNNAKKIQGLARREVRLMRAYQPAEPSAGAVQLHANEAPCALANSNRTNLNRYPANRPQELTKRMADLYEVAEDNLLVTRGSSEGIDLILRTFCTANRDNVLLTPPTFEMYQVYASLQGAGTINVRRERSDGFALDMDAVLAACNQQTKVLFLCSPNNPDGSLIPRDTIRRLLDAHEAKAIVVVDEAYIEYSNEKSLAPLVKDHENLVVLRTLSKAFALAGARCGAVVASPALIDLVSCVIPPYALSSLVIDSAMNALSDAGIKAMKSSVRATVAEKKRVQIELGSCRCVLRTWSSEANFLLVEFDDLEAIAKILNTRKIMIRTFDENSDLSNCARITIASPADNDCLINAVREVG